MKSFGAGLQSGVGTAFTSPAAATFPHYAIQQGIPYNVYGYSAYPPEYTYPTNYYNVYGGAAPQYPATYQPYYQFNQSGGGAAPYTYGQGYGMQYPQMYQYSSMASATGVTGFAAQHFGGAMSIAPNVPAPTGMTMALTTPALPSPHYRLVPSHFTTPTAREQPLT